MVENRETQALSRANSTMKNVIQGFFSGQKDTSEQAMIPTSFARPQMDKFLPFAYFLDLSSKTVEFVIDETIPDIRNESYRARTGYSSSPLFDKSIHDILDQQTREWNNRLIINGNDNIAKLFGFESNLKRKLSVFKNRDQQKAYKNFVQTNFIQSSTHMNWYQDEAEYANYMMVYIAGSDVWESEEFAAYQQEFNMSTKLLPLIRDFCQLEHMQAKITSWQSNTVIDRYTSKDQSQRIKEVKDNIQQTYKSRLQYLFILEQVFFKFKDMEEQWKNFGEIANLENDLSIMEDRVMDMEARQEALVYELQELVIQGQAFDSVTHSISSSLDDMLLELDSPLSEDEIRRLEQ